MSDKKVNIEWQASLEAKMFKTSKCQNLQGKTAYDEHHVEYEPVLHRHSNNCAIYNW